jgi:hypothetical protein
MDALFARQHAVAGHPVGEHIVAGRLGAEARLAVYRNNLRQSLADALAAVYPTVQQLVGDDFFRGMARRYLLRYPSRSGNLQEFGVELPDFIEGLEAAAALPYLPDVARLDWAWHAVFHAPAEPACDPLQGLQLLAAAPEAERGAARLACLPTVRLLASCHPLFDLWRWHQLPQEERGGLKLPAGGQALLVLRHGGEVQVLPLSAAEHGLLQALAGGAELAAAAAAALALQPDFELAASLARYFSLGVLAAPRWPELAR